MWLVIYCTGFFVRFFFNYFNNYPFLSQNAAIKKVAVIRKLISRRWLRINISK